MSFPIFSAYLRNYKMHIQFIKDFFLFNNTKAL